MARQPKNRSEHYEAYRKASGWYLAAWRDYRGLTLDELAAETGISRGHISDLETGAVRPGRPMKRYNRDALDSMARVLNTRAGRLIDLNPYTMAERFEDLSESIARLDERDREAVLSMVEHLKARRDGAATG